MIAPAPADEVLRRLRRAEGHLRGVQRSIRGGRTYRDVSIQRSAVIAALERPRLEVLTTGLRHSDEDVPTSDPDPCASLERRLVSGR